MAKPSDPKKPSATKAGKTAPAKSSPSPAKETAAKALADQDEATSQDKASQSARAKALWEKLHGASGQRNAGGPPGSQGKKGGFDPNQFRGGKGNMGSAHSQMLRRTQSRGGGGGGGGGTMSWAWLLALAVASATLWRGSARRAGSPARADGTERRRPDR